MHLDQLLFVLDLDQTHSFNQTAERHYTTQQSVSYSMKQLEKELNIQIFNRSKTGVSFTKEGQFVLQFAKEMQTSYQTLLHNLGREVSSLAPPEKLTLYISSVLLADSMPFIIKAFSITFPSTKLFIKEVSNDVIVPSLLNGTCDMAVWSVNHGYLEKNITPDDSERLLYNVIRTDNSVAVVSKDSKLAQNDMLTLEQINQASKSIFGVSPIDYFGKDPGAYILYRDDNPAIHQQLAMEDNTICFTSQIMYLFKRSVSRTAFFISYFAQLSHALTPKRCAAQRV